MSAVRPLLEALTHSYDSRKATNMKTIALLALLGIVTPAYAQTEVDLQTRAREIHETIVSGLESSHGDSKGKTWFESALTLEADWIVQSPSHQEYFSERSELPRSVDCKAGSAFCEETFQR